MITTLRESQTFDILLSPNFNHPYSHKINIAYLIHFNILKFISEYFIKKDGALIRLIFPSLAVRKKSTLIIAIVIFFGVNFHAQTKPKNIIVMIGDGMGHNYVSTALLKDKTHPLFAFPVTGLSVTICADKLITDSAAGASAIATGQLVNYYSISFSPEGKKLETIFDSAQTNGIKTGIVATSRLTNATPAAFFGNVYSRKEEDSLAQQFLNSNIDIAIAGGYDKFLPEDLGGTRKDGINIVSDLKENNYSFVNSFEDLKSNYLNGKLVALLSKEGLPKGSERDYGLDELSRFAIENLNQYEEGFMLMIEGSQIDWAGHDTDAVYLLSEMDDFSEAINLVYDFAKKDGETLVIITADHETGGMAIMDGNLDGTNLKLEFLSGDHTAGTVSVFAYGPGSELFSGTYFINDIGKKLQSLIRKDSH